MTITEQVRKIVADAFDIDELVHVAYVDACDSLLRLATRGQNKPVAIKILESWRVCIETAERKVHEKARRT
jgi:hypothetical protein